MHTLEMPDALACSRIQGQQRVGKQIVPDALTSIEIRGGRPGWYVDNARLNIQRDAGPVVGCTGIVPCIGWPGFRTEFTRFGDRVKRPPQSSGVNVISPDVAR